ncbi:hypothetical protein [Pseudochrobactrum sp. MP213Fo]|uniref:hypothetical protein n=1 Tax=Pseudochrobactrum sp. MP213Fo TaxID=3022250 RepID=UPI003BA12A54
MSLLFIGLPFSVFIAAMAERKYLESKSGAQYAEIKAFGIWIISLIIIFSIILLVTDFVAGKL